MVFPDFEEFIDCLNAERVRYLIVGAYAVAFHGHPRATKDIDVLIERSKSNAPRVIRALTRFYGVAIEGVSIEKLMNPKTLLVLGTPPVRIDVLTKIDGVTFSSAYKRRAEGTFGASKAQYLALDDLLVAKRASARMQDLADVESLERLSKRTVRRTKK